MQALFFESSFLIIYNITGNYICCKPQINLQVHYYMLASYIISNIEHFKELFV